MGSPLAPRPTATLYRLERGPVMLAICYDGAVIASCFVAPDRLRAFGRLCFEYADAIDPPEPKRACIDCGDVLPEKSFASRCAECRRLRDNERHRLDKIRRKATG